MRSSSSTEDKPQSYIDKDPIYRTHSIYQKIFDKKVTLRSGKRSETNCRGFIFLNFDQQGYPKVAYQEDELSGRKIYRMECGHTINAGQGLTWGIGKTIACVQCGSLMAYWSHQHEWSHIIFRSNPFLYTSFVEKYQHKLIQEGYDIRVGQLSEFFFLFVNAFDDIRVNSLEEHVYPGAAHEIWMKWKKTCEENQDLNNDFISFVFGVALDVNNLDHQNGPYSELIPVIKEATNKVRLKGPTNMLAVVRWALDRCVKKLLKDEPPKEDENEDSDQDQDNQNPRPQEPPKDGQGRSGSGQQGVSGQDQQEDSGSPGDDPPQGQQTSYGSDVGGSGSSSSGGSSGGDPNQTPGKALAFLARNANPLTEDEGFIRPNINDRDPASQATHAAAQQALAMDVGDDNNFDAAVKVGTPDADVKDALVKLQKAHSQPQATEFILSQAKSNILLVDVEPRDIHTSSKIDINTQDRQAIDRMRAAFARAMGREKYKMDSDGSEVDVSSVIQFLLDPSEDEMFDLEAVQRGFAYRILGDMSGSMQGDRFTTVCRAHELLKRALDYPFVQGDFWGFRGAEDYQSRRNNQSSRSWAQQVTRGGQLWLYRYDPECKGYLGRSKGRGMKGNTSVVDVKCGGLTPMNTALHVALKDLITQTPAGMAKRMFLLTDGNPTQFTTSGKNLNDKFLRGLVAKEIRSARQKGVQVYTFIIGTGIKDKHALEMFGPRRFWKKVDGEDRVPIGQALVEVVLSEFVKYLKSK